MARTRADYFRVKAVRCRYLADIANNHELRQLLDELAAEFEQTAAAIEGDPDDASDSA